MFALSDSEAAPSVTSSTAETAVSEKCSESWRLQIYCPRGANMQMVDTSCII